MRIRRVGYDETTDQVVHQVRRHGRDYVVRLRVETGGKLGVEVVEHATGHMIYQGQAPEFGDHSESNESALGSLWWAERMIDTHELAARRKV